MIGFLLEEGVLTVGTLSGLFTTALLNSLKLNIIDPSIENLLPAQPPPPPPPPPEENTSKSQFGDIFPIPLGPAPSPQTNKREIKWKVFLKDFFTWLLIMFCLFIFWKKFLHPIKLKCQAKGFAN